MDTFTQLIECWPTKTELAADCHVEYGVVHQWDRRNSIPAEHWNDVISSASKRGIQGIDLELLAALSARKKQNTH